MEEKYMHRCLALAADGLGSVSPNPMVGAVLVYDKRIIGEGYHEQFGEAHAEVNCIASVIEKDRKYIEQAVLYVSLEPCSHFGKTAPCADLIIEHRIKHVVVGCLDPNPLVKGNGIKKLMDAGIQVTINVLEKESKKLNKRFFVFHLKQRPYIILKWAQSAEGNFCPDDRSKYWLSNDESKKITHRWRSEEDAVLIGAGTAIIDNPALTVREWSGRHPVRVLLDRDLKTPAHYQIFNLESKTIVFNRLKDETGHQIQWIKINAENMLEQVIQQLYQLQIQSVIIEGGLTILQNFISLGLWDEARVIKTNTSLEAGLMAPVLPLIAYDSIRVGDNIIAYYQHTESV